MVNHVGAVHHCPQKGFAVGHGRREDREGQSRPREMRTQVRIGITSNPVSHDNHDIHSQCTNHRINHNMSHCNDNFLNAGIHLKTCVQFDKLFKKKSI